MITVKHTSKEEVRNSLPILMKGTESFSFESWIEENFLRDLKNKWELSLLVKLKNRIIGFSINSEVNNSLYIHYFFIFEEFRSKRVGNILLDNCIKLAKSRDFDAITLKCNILNFSAIKFYIKNEFTITSLEKDYYVMQRKL